MPFASGAYSRDGSNNTAAARDMARLLAMIQRRASAGTATNADAARQALSAYPKVFWIAGGKPKDGGIDDLTAGQNAARISNQHFDQAQFQRGQRNALAAALKLGPIVGWARRRYLTPE